MEDSQTKTNRPEFIDFDGRNERYKKPPVCEDFVDFGFIITPDGERIAIANDEAYQTIISQNKRFFRKIWRGIHASNQNHECYYCHGTMVDSNKTDGKTEPNNTTLEHLNRTADGGDDSFENTVAACYACNALRKGIPVEIYRKIRVTLLPIWKATTIPTKHAEVLLSSIQFLYGRNILKGNT